MENLRPVISAGNLGKYTAYIEKMLDEPAGGDQPENDLTSLDIAAALLKMTLGPNFDLEESGNDLLDNVSDSPTVRLFMTVGNMDKVQPRDIIQSISTAVNIPRKLIGAIEILDKFTFVEVPREYATEVMEAMKNTKIKGRRINVERANQKGKFRRRKTDH